MSIGQDANWDFKNYHYYNGYAFLTGRFDHDLQPAQLQSYYNPLLDAATYLLAAVTPPRFVGFTLGAVHGLNLWLIFVIASTVLEGFENRVRVVASLACALAGAFGAMGITELGTTFHDLTVCPLILTAVLVVLRAIRAQPTRRTLFEWAVAGGLCGLAAGLKYTMILYAPAAVIATLASGRFSKGTFLRAGVLGTGVVVGVLCTAGHWMLRLAHRVGNPLFPYYNQLFHSPYTEPVGYVDSTAVPKSLGHALTLPFRFTGANATGDMPFRDFRLAAVCLLGATIVGIWVAGRILKRPTLAPFAAPRDASVWLFVFFGVAYVIWIRQWAIYRYTLPLEQLAPLVILLLTSTIVRGRTQLVGVSVFAFGLLGATTKPGDYGRVPWSGDFLGVRAPVIAAPSKTVVVMTSTHPMAYVIPAFPAEARFVRIESNFFSPGRKTKLAEIVADALRSADRDYRLITVYDSLERSPALLAAYGLAIGAGSCRPIESKFDADLLFCELRKIERPSGDASSPLVFGVVAAAAGMSGKLVADPFPVPVCEQTGVGVTTVSWTSAGTDQVEVRVDSPSGTLFAQSAGAGSSVTGPWVREGTTFYLQNVAHGAPRGPEQTLARLVVRTIGGGSCR